MRTQLLTVGGMLVCSGLCALVFQTTWMQELQLVFGGASTASAAVLAVFMAGLGIGNAYWGARVDRAANPLALYGRLELAIAAAAALSPFLIDASTWLYIATGGQTRLGVFGATVVRLLLTAVVLGLPTFLMGGTLAAAVKAASSVRDEKRIAAALLYGGNTFGAVIGALLATFWMLPQYGLRRTLWTFCALNAAVAVVALWRSKAFLVEPVSAVPETSPRAGKLRASARQKDADDNLPPATLFLYFTSAGTGFAFFLMELVWFRLLGTILGGTVFTFGLILAVALAGIGLGGFLHALVFRRFRPTYAGLAFTCFLEALCIAFPLWLGDAPAVWAARLQQQSTTFAGGVGSWTLIALLIVFPAALVSGVQFPLLISLLGKGTADIGRQLGRAFAWNTCGAIVGSLAGGFGLLPLLTAPGAWRFVVGCLLALGFAATAVSYVRKEYGRVMHWAALGTALLTVMGLFGGGPTALWRHSGLGVGRLEVPQTRRDLQAALNHENRDVLWQAEGVQAGIGLIKGNGLAFYVNGKSDGNATGDAGTQIMLGLLGSLLHLEPREALVIGLGTGETAGWLAETPGMRKVTVVELEPAVDRMAAECAAVNHDVLRHPRVERIYNDAREVLLTTRAEFDLIISEPSNPYRPGVADLFTREFYAASAARLRHDGIFVQWLQGYDIDEETVRSVLKTLKSVFAHVEIWKSAPGDMLLVCRSRPPLYRVSTLQTRLEREPFRSGVRYAWREDSLERVWARFVANDAFVSRIAAEQGPVNTDDWNVVRYGFARTLGNHNEELIEHLRRRAEAEGNHRASFADDDKPDDDLVDGTWRAAHEMAVGRPWNSDVPESQRIRLEMLRSYSRTDMPAAIAAYERLAPDFPLSPDESAAVALAYADTGKSAPPQLAERLQGFQPADLVAIEAYAAFRRGDLAAAGDGFERVFLGLRKDPWLFSHAAELAFFSSVTIARENPDRARRLYQALSEPFAVYSYDDFRMGSLWRIAALAGPQELVACLPQYEPHVPWERDFLETRMQAYEVTRHPLAPKAARELLRFLQEP